MWSDLDYRQNAHRLERMSALDDGLVLPIHRWASGRGLDAVLTGTDLAAGDFVRWCKQVIDLLDQVRIASADTTLADVAAAAVAAVRRGVVALGTS